MSESGALHILDESLVLAASSNNGLIKNKNCNRSQRVLKLLSLAFEFFHFQLYLAKIPNKMSYILFDMFYISFYIFLKEEKLVKN